jgi:peptide/nickel transport system substrate-binding protein
MELEANPDFYKGKPKIERLVFKFGGSSKLTELLSGNVDVASYVKQTDIAKLAQDGRFRIYYSFYYNEAMALQWNHRHFLFKDATVRRALTMAINRRELFEVLNFPPDVPIFDGLGSYPRAQTQYEKGLLGEPIPFDPERARALLESAGWQDTDGDGIREKNGEPARFEVLVYSDRILSTVEPGVYIQDQLRSIGVQMDIKQSEQFVAGSAYFAGNFDAAFWEVKNEPTTLLKQDWFGDKSPIGYKNPDVVRLLQEAEKAALANDLEGEDRIFQKIWQIFINDAPVTFLFAWPEAYVAHKRLQGMGKTSKSVAVINPISIMEDLWIED